jgi:hypothetical protein
MIKRWWKQFIYNRMARIIEKAAASATYEKYQYLCPSIGVKTSNPLKRKTIRFVEDSLRGYPTLYSTIRRALREEGYDPKDHMWYVHLDWPERMVIHRAYWAKVVAELRKGNPTWGKYFNTKEIQADPPHLRDLFDPSQPGTKSDQILDQLRKDAA